MLHFCLVLIERGKTYADTAVKAGEGGFGKYWHWLKKKGYGWFGKFWHWLKNGGRGVWTPPIVGWHNLWTSPYQPIIMKIKCEKVTPPFSFDHLLNQVPKNLYFKHGLESALIFTNYFFLLGGNRAVCLKKVPTIFLICFKNWTWKKSKSQIYSKLLEFLEHDMT